MTWNEFLTEAGTILGLAKKGLDKPMAAPAAKSVEPPPIDDNMTMMPTATWDAYQKEVSVSKGTISTLTDTLALKETRITKLTADLAASAQALATAQASLESKASHRAAEIMAAVGHPPIPVVPTASPASAKPTDETNPNKRLLQMIQEQIAVQR